GCGSGRPGGELRGPRPAAHAQLPCAQALDLVALLWRRGLPRDDRHLPRSRAARAAADRGLFRARADVAGIARRRHVPTPSGRLRRPSLESDTLRLLPLFASLDDEQAENVLRTAYENHAVAGESLIEQWQVSRDLYVVLSGAVEVSADGTSLRTLGPGEFFG